MKRPTPAPDPAPRFGSILPGEVMPLAEAARRLGWQKRMTIDAQKMGLRSVLIGRRKYTTGDWVLQFVEAQAQQQAGRREQ
jgi:hypothetical protein